MRDGGVCAVGSSAGGPAPEKFSGARGGRALGASEVGTYTRLDAVLQGVAGDKGGAGEGSGQRTTCPSAREYEKVGQHVISSTR